MNLHPALLIGAYIQIGIFVGSIIDHFDDQSIGFDMYMLCILFWPMFIILFALIAFVYIPHILGKWIGYLLHDLLR